MEAQTKSKFKVDRKDFTVSHPDFRDVLFGHGEYANGFWLCFWSHSPWGRCHDMEQGWMVVDVENGVLVDDFETKCMGHSMTSGWGREKPSEWKSRNKAMYGKLKRFKGWNGELPWKKSEQ